MSGLNEPLEAIRARPPRWVDTPALPPMRLRDGGVLTDKARAGFIADLKSEGPDSRAVLASATRHALEAEDCAALMRALWADWTVAGQPAKDRRWLIFATGLLGDAALLDALGRRVGDELAGRRHKAAGYCVASLSRAGGPTARRWLGRWSRQAPGLTLRAAAWSARLPLDEAAGWSATVAPHDHGFSARGEQDYAHGARALHLHLAADGEVQIFEGTRHLKTLPAARKQDDPAEVRRSRARFKALKASVRDSLRAVDEALEEAMVLGWPIEDWPALRDAALGWRASRGLVFCAGSATFFVSDEGDTLDVNGDDIAVPAGAPIRVAHPLDLNDKARAAWRTILDDARAVPPFDQLGRTTRRPLEGPAPLAKVLRALQPLSTPRLIRGLKARGFLPDTFESYGLIERSMKFLGPYLIVISHEGYSANPFKQRPTQRLQLRAIEIRHGQRKVPSEVLPVSVFSEIATSLLSL